MHEHRRHRAARVSVTRVRGRRVTVGLACCLVLSLAGSASAQDASTGRGPAHTGAASRPTRMPNPNVTAVGETKPPGAPLGPAEGTSPQLKQEHRWIDQRVLKSICAGAQGCQ